jgi:hypothetical protein
VARGPRPSAPSATSHRSAAAHRRSRSPRRGPSATLHLYLAAKLLAVAVPPAHHHLLRQHPRAPAACRRRGDRGAASGELAWICSPPPPQGCWPQRSRLVRRRRAPAPAHVDRAVAVRGGGTDRLQKTGRRSCCPAPGRELPRVRLTRPRRRSEEWARERTRWVGGGDWGGRERRGGKGV